MSSGPTRWPFTGERLNAPLRGHTIFGCEHEIECALSLSARQPIEKHLRRYRSRVCSRWRRFAKPRAAGRICSQLTYGKQPGELDKLEQAESSAQNEQIRLVHVERLKAK